MPNVQPTILRKIFYVYTVLMFCGIFAQSCAPYEESSTRTEDADFKFLRYETIEYHKGHTMRVAITQDVKTGRIYAIWHPHGSGFMCPIEERYE